jgi:hypothetical protein
MSREPVLWWGDTHEIGVNQLDFVPATRALKKVKQQAISSARSGASLMGRAPHSMFPVRRELDPVLWIEHFLEGHQPVTVPHAKRFSEVLKHLCWTRRE